MYGIFEFFQEVHLGPELIENLKKKEQVYF